MASLSPTSDKRVQSDSGLQAIVSWLDGIKEYDEDCKPDPSAPAGDQARNAQRPPSSTSVLRSTERPAITATLPPPEIAIPLLLKLEAFSSSPTVCGSENYATTAAVPALSTCSPSADSGSVGRPESPARPVDLDPFAEPIAFGTASANAVDMPQDIASLQPRLNDLLWKDRILPAELRDDPIFRKSCGGNLTDRMFENPYVSIVKRDQALRDFDEILNIVEATEKAIRYGFSEFSWNDSVNSPLLELALKPFASKLRCRDVTSARLLLRMMPEFASTFAVTAAAKNGKTFWNSAASAERYVESSDISSESTPVGDKMVDFSINLEPDLTLLGAIDSALFVPTEYSPFGTNTINQTLHEAVRLCPAAVSIGTKTNRAGVGNADVKLAVWMAAWRARVMPLVDWNLKMGLSARCITQLGIMAVGETWKLYFLVDDGITFGAPRLRLLEYPEAIGSTRTVVEVYQLIAVLRHLCGWADRYLRDWVMDALACNKHMMATG